MIRWIAGLGCCLALVSCGGGGGSSSARSGQLLSVTFPDPADVNSESEKVPPQSSPLNQRVVFEFSEAPSPAQVSAETIRIRDSQGVAPEGEWRVAGRRVTFIPRYPLRPIQREFGVVVDSGGAGLRPEESYSIQLGPGTWPDFLVAVESELRGLHKDPADSEGVAMVWRTTADESAFFRGVEPTRPRLVQADPVDGSVGVSPQLHGDPNGLFPPRRAFWLRFDRALHPSSDNLGRFRLIDVDERSEQGDGMALGIDVHLRENTDSGALIEVAPSGILPFGHLLALEYPTDLRGLGEEPDAGDATRIATTFTIASASRSPVVDQLSENFDNTDHQSRDSKGLGPGEIPASWDSGDSNVLVANFAFEGRGELGRLAPPAASASDPRVLVLDTSVQPTPLLDGSTPDAPQGKVVGGRFSFTDIDIPEHVTVEVRGPNPLILTATGSVRIAGTILMNGSDGQSANTFDSAVFALPGGPAGPGGGRGGEGHPIVYFGPPATTNLVSPIRGGHGWGPSNRAPIGGRGGMTGNFDSPDEDGLYTTDRESNCHEGIGHNPGFRPGGGGGGSLLELGSKPQTDGIGNVLADGRGGFIVRTPQTHGDDYNVLPGGEPGKAVFADDNPTNDFIGLRGEIQEVIGGQGGGAGGSGLDAYYCGAWCKRDRIRSNDKVCKAELGQGRNSADSVGDGRGGAGGGGGGAISIRALGEILLESTAQIFSNGGRGGGGEFNGCGNLAGCGGGGSGGAVLLHSGSAIRVEEGAVIETKAGRGRGAARDPGGCNLGLEHPSSGGTASLGLIQMQVPQGQVAEVEDLSTITRKSWVDKTNTRNPAEFTPVSAALSKWYDMGRAIAQPPSDTNPVYSFHGLDQATGVVLTDTLGYVQNPEQSSIRVDFLGVSDPSNPGQFLSGMEPRANYVPPNATVSVAFQGASAIVSGSKEIDPETISEWSHDPSIANGKQFIRYRVTFDLTAGEGSLLTPDTPRPTVQELTIHAEF